jgi:hypothetical protein
MESEREGDGEGRGRRRRGGEREKERDREGKEEGGTEGVGEGAREGDGEGEREGQGAGEREVARLAKPKQISSKRKSSSTAATRTMRERKQRTFNPSEGYCSSPASESEPHSSDAPPIVPKKRIRLPQ